MTRLLARWSGVWCLTKENNLFLLLQNVQTGYGALQPPVECVPWVLGQECEGNLSCPCSFEVKNEQNTTSDLAFYFYICSAYESKPFPAVQFKCSTLPVPKPPLNIIHYQSIYLFLCLCYSHIFCLPREISLQNCCKYFLCPPPEGYFQPITTFSILLFCFCEQAWHLHWHSVVSMHMLSPLPSAVFVEDTLHQRQLMFRLNNNLVTTALVRFLCFLQAQGELFWSTVSSYPFLVHENQDHGNFGLAFNKNV